MDRLIPLFSAAFLAKNLVVEAASHGTDAAGIFAKHLGNLGRGGIYRHTRNNSAKEK